MRDACEHERTVEFRSGRVCCNHISKSDHFGGAAMAKTVSVTDLGHGRASRAIRDAQVGPVLVSKENRPAAWLLSAERLAQVAAAHGSDVSDLCQHALELLAVDLCRDGILTLGQGAKLAGLSLGDFIDLAPGCRCRSSGRPRVAPTLRFRLRLPSPIAPAPGLDGYRWTTLRFMPMRRR